MAGDYVSMQARLADELLTGSTITTAQIKIEILSSIQHYERQRFWFNEGSATASTVAATNNVGVPSDLLEIDSIDVTYAGHPYPLDRATWDWYSNVSARDVTVGRGPPETFVYYQNLFYLYPVPDTAYTLLLSYLKQLATLSADADTNAWMVDGEALIRHRTRAAIKINYQQNPDSIAEAAGLPGGYLSKSEMAARSSLLRTSVGRISTGRVTATDF